MSKYLISGKSGFIGTALSNYLHERGDIAIELKRGITANTFALKNEFDIHQPDYIIHLAAYGNHSYQKDEYEIFYANVIAGFNMLLCSLDIDYKKFYNVSSSSVTLPQQTLYSATKLSMEKIAEVFAAKYNKPIVNVRPYSVYGPGEAAFRFIPVVIAHLLTGEEMTVDENAAHDWIYIDDFIKAMLAGETEIGTGIKTSNKEIIQILEDISGEKLNYKPGKFRDYDNENWFAAKGVEHISLREGLEKTFNHYSNEK